MNADMNSKELSWRKSSFSNPQGGECVEVADLPDGQRALRDTKDRGAGPVLLFADVEWTAFVRGVKNGGLND